MVRAQGTFGCAAPLSVEGEVRAAAKQG